MNISEFRQRITKTERPIVVDFWAEWCMPCRITKPILEKLAQEYGDEVEFMPIDADASREVLEQFQVIGIPTVLAIRNGEVHGRVTGAQSESSYRAMFEGLIAGRKIKIPMSSFDRTLRLGAGILLMLIGFSAGSWVGVGFGGVIAFLGIYDRCPIWRALTGMLARR